MRICYTIPFKSELIIPDHWSIPLLGGVCRVVTVNGLAKALEVVFIAQPVIYAPHAEVNEDGSKIINIIARDPLMQFVKKQLGGAMVFLSCYHEISLGIDSIEAHYEAESEEERKLILVKSMRSQDNIHPLQLGFDMLTRAIMAAENVDGPIFETTLASFSRKALFDRHYINSFRYSFLLIEFLYGEGQFKSASLKKVFKGNSEFIDLVEKAINDQADFALVGSDDTSRLLANSPSASQVIDHLVDKRGYYFHGNGKRDDGWKPENQNTAKSLAMLTIEIVHLITNEAAKLMFEDRLNKRHFDNAKSVGAMLMFTIEYGFKNPGESFLQHEKMTVEIPGVKVTAKSSLEVMKHFIESFEDDFPFSSLSRAQCTLQNNGGKIFDIQFYVES